MKRIVALVSVAILLLLGVAVNNFGDDSPVVTSSGDDTTQLSGDLAALGPMSLIDFEYTATQGISCNVPQSTCAGQLQNVADSSGFTIDGNVSVTGCTGVNGFTINIPSLPDTNCELQGNDIHLDVDVSRAAPPTVPCYNTMFAQVTLTNSVTMDTLVVSVIRDSKGAGACTA